MRIVVAAVGRLKRGPETELSERYAKRAAQTGRSLGLRDIDVIEIRESRADDAGKRMLEESIALANVIPPGAAVVLLDAHGDNLDSASLAAQLAKWRANHVGFVFQFYNLMPVLSAEGNVELPLLLTKLSSAQRKKNVAVALQIVGLSDRAKHKPKELSGGQEQRVAIARALVSDPQLLVCDEPTGDLDRKTADEILGLLQVLNREHGKTIVMVTHDPKAAEFARRVLHLEKGTLVEQAA